jgi:hypothetical protein
LTDWIDDMNLAYNRYMHMQCETARRVVVAVASGISINTNILAGMEKQTRISLVGSVPTVQVVHGRCEEERY